MIQIPLSQISALISTFFIILIFSSLFLSLSEALYLLEVKYFCGSLRSIINFLNFSKENVSLSMRGIGGEIVAEGTSINFSSNRYKCEMVVITEVERTRIEVDSKLTLLRDGNRVYLKNG